MERYKEASGEVRCSTQGVDESPGGSLEEESGWVDSLMGAGFQINNPNAKSSCACGDSFQ